MADKALEASGLSWRSNFVTTPGAYSNIDGPANTAALVGIAASTPAADYCAGLTVDGHSDFYLMSGADYDDNVDGGWEFCDAYFLWQQLAPSRNVENFKSGQAQAFSSSEFYWSSTESKDGGGVLRL